MAKRGNRSGDEVARTAAAISENYRAFQYRFVQFLAEHLADCSRTFGGDLQQMLVLAIIGQVALNARARDPKSDVDGGVSITASRISDVTGIPRETVRRKLRALEDKKWIVRQTDSSWRLAFEGDQAPARRDLAELDQRGIARLAALLTTLRPLL